MMDSNLVARYLAGECSTAEAEAVCRWAATDPASGAELDLLRRAWTRAGELPAPPRIEAMWERVSADVVRSRHPVLSLVSARPAKSRAGRRALLAAAAVVALAGALFTGHRFAPGGASQSLRGPVAAREYRTARGQRATVVLLDGTQVSLGVDSRLRVPDPRSERREVYLDGEAMFDVAHDARRPFIVHAGPTIARDIGTVFGVRAYDGEPVRVVVASGSVAVRDTTRMRDAEAVLTERQLARVHDGVVDVETNVDPRRFLAWTHGELVFHHEPLASVAEQLDRWYDIDMDIPSPALRDARVTLSFDDDSLDSVLQLLAASLDARVERNGRRVVLEARQ